MTDQLDQISGIGLWFSNFAPEDLGSQILVYYSPFSQFIWLDREIVELGVVLHEWSECVPQNTYSFQHTGGPWQKGDEESVP